MRRILLSTVLAALWAAGAHAAPVTLSFSGSVTDDPFGISHFGAPISGTYTYDPTAVDAIVDPSTGSYASVGPLYIFTVDVDGTTYTVDTGVTINIANDIGVDQYGVIAQSGSLTLELLFQDSTQTALSSDALPSTAPSLAAFDFVQFQLFADDAQFNGAVTQIACTAGCTTSGGGGDGGGDGGGGTVPEPSLAALLGIGGLAWSARRRSSRAPRLAH